MEQPKADFWKEQGEKLKAAVDRMHKANCEFSKVVGRGEPRRFVGGTYTSRGITFYMGDGTTCDIKNQPLLNI